MEGFIAKGVGFNVDESARSDERDSEGAPLRRGDVYRGQFGYRELLYGKPVF